MTDIVVPQTPPLARIANVELMHTGTWNISTGAATFTTEDLYQAVAALECPAVRRPILKLGHTDPRFDGEPAVGYIDNLAVADNGYTLVGDYAGMPGWLGDVIASAYPDRSIEGEYDFRCQMGHTHPFVLTGLALLGVSMPGIGTLGSLQDVAQLYGVTVAASVQSGGGNPVHIEVHAKEATVPNPAPRKVAATVTSEDVKRAFYDSPMGQSWDAWITELQLDPLQLIYTDDGTGDSFRVMVTVDAKGEGTAAVSFGEPVKVITRYEDAAVAAGRPASIRYASKAESRPVAAAPQTPPAEPVEGNTPTPTPEVPVSDDASTLREGLLARLGVTDADVDDGTLLAALEEALAERATPPKEPALPVAATAAGPPPNGAVIIDSTTLELIQAQARRGDEAFARMAADERDRTIAAAVTDGKISRARVEHWRTSWSNDPEGAKQALAAMPKGLVPVEVFGGPGDPDAFNEEYAQLFPPSREA
jgi:hypothetical protein